MEIAKLTDKELLQTLLKLNQWTQQQLASELGFKTHAQISKVINEKGRLVGTTRRSAELLLELTLKKQDEA